MDNRGPTLVLISGEQGYILICFVVPDTPTNVSELDINGEDLEDDELIDEPNSPGNISSGESPLFDCPMCCGKQFSLMDLQQHISRYIWGSLKCPVCDEVCVGLEILAVHLDEHHSALEMTVSENSLLTNVDKYTVSSEESVNISCGDVRSQVIEDQTIVSPDFDKERITVDKSVNGGKNTGGTEKQDKEIGEVTSEHVALECIFTKRERAELLVPIQANAIYHILRDVDRWSYLDEIADKVSKAERDSHIDELKERRQRQNQDLKQKTERIDNYLDEIADRVSKTERDRHMDELKERRQRQNQDLRQNRQKELTSENEGDGEGEETSDLDETSLNW
uniref:Uncharacterized protein n=1 Tax=Timema genevievae TaxID=629358 RepID=A0A7R9JV99_TIMGE|nr:unnamed protein product [Timema genevievae]